MNAPVPIRGEFAEAFEQITGQSPEEFQAAKNARDNANDTAWRDGSARLTDELLSNKGLINVKSWRDKQRIKSDTYGGRGLQLARYVGIQYLAKTQNKSAADIALRMGETRLADEIKAWEESDAFQKALAAGVASGGGTLVPEALAADMIELLRAQAVMRKAGVQSIDMPNGNLRFGRQSAAASASWGSENRATNASQQTTDELNFSSKKLVAITPISNDLLRVPTVAADQFVRNDLLKVCALAEDYGFIRGTGTAGAPKGIRYALASGNIFARAQASSPSTTIEIQNDLMKAPRKCAENNVVLQNPFWIMNATTEYGLKGIRNSLGQLVFMDEMKGGTLMGFPYFVSNQIPNNLGGGDEGEVYFVEGSECLIADQYALSIEVFPNGTYVDSTSTMVSGISTDQTVVRAISLVDFGLRHNVGASVITTVDWPT